MKKLSYYSLQTKLIVLFLGISFFSIFIVAGISLLNSRKSIIALSKEKIQSEISLNAHYIESVMSEYKADIRLLANTPPPRAMIRAKNNDGVDPVSDDDLNIWKKRFTTILKATFESKKFYQQARFLYEGKEVLRVNFENGKAVVVQEEDLQDKQDAIYFKEALKLREGEIYISELNLNRERGGIQIPYTPVLRFSTPIFSQGVKTPGVFVLNVYAESFLKNLKDESGRTYLANEQGFYLYHKNFSRTFGFDLGNKTDTLFNDFPEVTRKFHSQESYNSFSGQENIFLQKIHFDSKNFQRYWLIAKDVPLQNILAPANDLRQKIFYIILIISPFIFLLALMVSRGITSPIQKLADLVNQLSKGNFEIKEQDKTVLDKKKFLNIVQTREISQLEQSVEQMRINLRDTTVAEQKAVEELQATNKELEEKTEHLEKQKNEILLKNTEVEKAKTEVENKAKDLEEASRYKSEFLANMSHELRTPLNSLLILSKMLMDNEEANLTKDQVESASVIYSSGSDLLALINEILDLSKVESGKMEVYLGDVRIDEIASNIERNFRHVAQERGVHLEINVGEGLPLTLKTDGQKLGQILKNLLSNAFKFTEEGSVVVNIDRPEVSVDFLQNGLDSTKAIAISVTDTGIGIPPEKHDLIFEAFKQVDGTTQRKYGGTGLGLSISKKFISILGGEIVLKSEHGEGTTITLYLPETLSVDKDGVGDASSNQQKMIRNAHDQEGVFKSKKVLVVDDDMRNTFALSKALKAKGMDVFMAENGEVALEQLKKNQDIDIVLMDIMMPVMNGFETIKEIRRQHIFAKLSIIALTAKAMKGDKEKCIEAGANDYLSKPVDMEKLFSMLRIWLYR